jgi:small-conductance mechanosensitive channel
MIKKLFIFIVLAILTGVAWTTSLNYSSLSVNKIVYSLVAITASYLVFKLFLEGAVSKKINDSRAQYSFRKTTQLLFIVVSLIIILRIWIINPQALLVAYGLVTAGVAIALQDVFKNLAGAMAILLTGIYRVGDRIEINNKYGDVIDIGLFYTTLLEIREWVNGDQATGRLSVIPNGLALSQPVNNYTKDHSFIWDEINIPITYHSDWQEALKIVTTIAKNHSKAATLKAEKEIRKLQERYYLSKRNIESTSFISLTDNWIMIHLRYIADVRERRIINNQISQKILLAFEKNKNIKIASTSVTINS